MRFLKSFIPSLAFAFGMVTMGCESKADLARKPGLVDSLVKQSIELCDTSHVTSDGAPYAQRLKKALMDCTTEDLATLKDNNIAIAFDRRLSGQKLGVFDSQMKSVFYNNGNESGTLALWDDGAAETSFWNDDPYARVGEIVGKLAGEIRDKNIPADMQIGIAKLKSRQSGKTTTHYIDWVKAEDFDKDTRAKNDAILRTTPRRRKNAGGSW